MTRNVPGGGAKIEPIFDEVFGVRAVKVLNGGSAYDPEDPPRLTITGCGTPEQEALLYPIIDEESGRIVHVRVLERGRGYDPLRLQIIPEQETPNVVNSFNINRIWQSHPNSPTTGTFQVTGTGADAVQNDRVRIVSDNHPKPSQFIMAEREPGGSSTVVDRSFDQILIYRGGKDVPNPEDRVPQRDKSVGIMANGVLLHTPDWGLDGEASVNFPINSPKYSYVKDSNTYGAVIDGGTYYYQTNKLINEFDLGNSVFDWGNIEVFTWNIKVEFDNILVNILPTSLDQSLGPIEVGRRVDEVGGNAYGYIAKIVTDSNGTPTKAYIRNITGGPFADGDLLLGANGFQFRINGDPITFPNGIFYIDFGEDAEEFGSFESGKYYFAPENIRVQRNYLIKWNQSDPSNQHHGGHPMQFSTTQDGVLNGGSLYYNSTGVTGNWSADYENEYQPLFIMNADETNRIYYYCKNHRYMSGYTGDEGYMILDSTIEEEDHANNYYTKNYYQTDTNDPNTIDKSRHVNGHSKILGVSFDGYPIYGPWGQTDNGTVRREESSYRLKTTAELPGARPKVNTATTTTYAVTVSNDKFLFDGSTLPFIELDRGRTYIFNQDDASNNNQQLLFSTNEDGWHGALVGDTSYLYGESHSVTYHLDGSAVTFANYSTGFNSATTREIKIVVPVDAPRLLYIFAYNQSDAGVRGVCDGYLLGDLIDDFIYDSAEGTLDEYNGRFAVTPDYPNGTYAYFMTENSSAEPTYPYGVGPKMYGVPLFEGDAVPDIVSQFPTEATGEVVLSTDNPGQVSYIKMTKTGDNYFGPAKAKILGGQGTGAAGTPTVQTVTGLSLLNPGRSYATPPTLIFEGGGGQGAQGAAEIDTLGKVTNINIVDAGEFYQEPPFVLITGGGGIGAKAEATIFQGEITGINITDPGKGYTSPPNIIFTKLVNLKRKTRARQALNASPIYLTGLTKTLGSSDDNIYVDSTDAFAGSGSIIVNTETISYTSKSEGRFSGLTRGVNFNYDQRVVLDTGQDDADGVSTYQYNVGDRVVRRIDNANNKVAKVYDWNPNNRELLVTFEVDELAFIDAGIPSTEDAIVQFDAGVAASANSSYQPHVVVEETGSTISLLTVPLSTLQDRAFEDDDEQDGAGDGIPDLVNTGTDYENQISLDGGIYNSLYGIEETQGGQNTTLFQVGDSIKDASIPFRYATIIEAGGLSDGVEHVATLTITVDISSGNGQNYSTNEVVTGAISGVRGTVVSWTASTGQLVVQDIIPFNTGNVNKGIGGLLYEFSEKNTIVDFLIQNAGTNYSSTPTVSIEDTGDIAATATVNMTTAGDQVESLTITNGGYGIPQTVDGTYNIHPTVTFSGGSPDTTAVAQAILGGEMINGNAGASYRIKKIDYQTTIRSK